MNGSRSLRWLLAATACIMLGSRASSATIIPGGNIITQTWTVAGSPYIVQGDITIPAGAFLTIQPGVSVQFASTDSQAAGLDVTRVEATVIGTLTANGTSASPITFRAQTGTAAGTWYGVVGRRRDERSHLPPGSYRRRDVNLLSSRFIDGAARHDRLSCESEES